MKPILVKEIYFNFVKEVKCFLKYVEKSVFHCKITETATHRCF